MNKVAKVVSALALAATIVPALLFFAGSLELAPMKTWMLAGALAWFAATPFWMGRSAR